MLFQKPTIGFQAKQKPTNGSVKSKMCQWILSAVVPSYVYYFMFKVLNDLYRSDSASKQLSTVPASSQTFHADG